MPCLKAVEDWHQSDFFRSLFSPRFYARFMARPKPCPLKTGFMQPPRGPVELSRSKREFMQPIYGVMQSRLSPPEEGRFQAFPRRTWRDEIRLAQEAGFSYIEWIHDDYDKDANPIFSESGRLELDALKKQYGVSTPALCGDWFMDFPLVRCQEQEREEREQHLCDLLPIAEKIGARKIVLPFVDNSKLSTAGEKQAIVGLLNPVLPLAEVRSFPVFGRQFLHDGSQPDCGRRPQCPLTSKGDNETAMTRADSTGRWSPLKRPGTTTYSDQNAVTW
jgi:hypothetical protein